MTERLNHKGNSVDEAEETQEETAEETQDESQKELELEDDVAPTPEETNDEGEGDESEGDADEPQPEGEDETPPKEEVDTDFVPQLIQRHRPVVAKIWKELTPEHRQSIQEGILQTLEQEPEPESAGEPEPEQSPQRETPVAPEQVTQASTAGFDYLNQPDDVTPERMDSLIDELSLSDAAAQTMRDVHATGIFALGVTKDWGSRAMAEVERTSKRTVTLVQEKAFDAALDKHDEEMAKFTVAEYTSIVKAASELVASGRVQNEMDAVSLAISRANKGEGGAGTPRTRRRRMAASVRGSNRRGPKMLGEAPISGSWEDQVEYAKRKVAQETAK